MLIAAVLSARNVGINLKKRRFLMLIRIVVHIKTFYFADYQHLMCNTKNSVFRQRTTTRRQISAVRAVRMAFLLSLFASIIGHDLSRLSPVC